MSERIIFVATPLKPEPGDPGWERWVSGSLYEARAREEAAAANINFAAATCRAIALAGHVPFAPHLLFTRFLDDRLPDERVLGINAGLHMMGVSDEVWLRLPSWREKFSRGMEEERGAAERLRARREDAGSFAPIRPLVILIEDDNHFERELARLRYLRETLRVTP